LKTLNSLNINPLKQMNTATYEKLRAENKVINKDYKRLEVVSDRLLDDYVALGKENKALKGIMKKILPLNGYGECFYCSVGSKPDEDMMHFDADNCWHGDQKCLDHPDYSEVVEALNEKASK